MSEHHDTEVPLLLDVGADGPAKKPRRERRSTLKTVCPFILGNEFCERLAFTGLATNFVMYLTQVMGMDAASAAIIVMVFEGTAYITPLLGAYLADSFWGRYKTILAFSSIYALGMIALALTAVLPGLTPGPGEEASAWQQAALAGALGVISLGTGGIKPNVSAFGADQFDETNPQDRAEKQSFFNWFYLAINMGGLISCTAIVWVQDNVSWPLGFALPALAMIFALLLFLAGSSRYRHVAPTESPMARVAKVVAAAIHNRWRSDRRGAGAGGFLDSAAHGGGDGADHESGGGGWPGGDEEARTLLGGALPVARYPAPPSQGSAEPEGQLARSSRSYGWLEDAITEWQSSQGSHVAAQRHGYTPQQVEEVKMVLRLLPVFLTTAVYWTVYAMMGTMFIQQGSLMNNAISLPGLTFHVPSATMALFNTGAIILLVPVYDRILEPWMTRLGAKFTLLQRIGWGMLVAVLAMLYASGLESVRLHIFRSAHHPPHVPTTGGGAPCGDPRGLDCELVPLNIMWQAPAYVLIGASEVLASIGQLEFFYDQAPDVMRSCSMALQLLSVAVGSYLGGSLVAAVQAVSGASGDPWLPKDLNHGHMDYFFLLTGTLMALNLGLFLWVASRYEYKAVEHRVGAVKAPTLEEAAGGLRGAGGERRPLPPGLPRGGGGVTIAAAAARRAAAARGGGGGGASGSDAGDSEEGVDLYSRSLAYFPASPALPAPFR